MSAPEILFEDKYMLAVNKPQGIVTEYDARHPQTLESLVLEDVKAKEKYPDKCFIGLPHRLDRPVSGVVLFAKKRSVLKQLAQMFEARTIRKGYLAVVERKPPQDEGDLVHWLKKDQKNRKAIVYDHETADAVQAVLHYRLAGASGKAFLLQVQPLTGKFHQIRAQLAFIGCPVIGDVLYGSALPYPAQHAIALHALQLELTHPVTGELLKVTAPVPGHEVWEQFGDIET